MLTRLHHVAVLVPDLDAALSPFRDLLGLPVSRVETVGEQQVRVAFLPVGETRIELVEPLDRAGGLGRFLEKTGGGLHHVCFEVDDIAAALAELRRRGARLIDERPRPGGHGMRVAFVHPSSTARVLVELAQDPGRLTASDPRPTV
jgi:methylmalonyl-CoA/ethylmalonyl-CoA epimerase